MPLYNSRTLPNDDELVGGNVEYVLRSPIGPLDRKICRGVTSQTKMQPAIIAGVETGLCQHLLRLLTITVTGDHA